MLSKIQGGTNLGGNDSTAAAEDRRQHLEFIQSAIARMSSASAVAKGWALTIAVAAYGYAGTNKSILVTSLALFATVLFAVLDARYLREEKKYRILYDGARTGAVDVHDMNATAFCNSLSSNESAPIRWGKVLNSWSVREYYGAIALVGIILLVWISCSR
jgi:hypothetical protein